MIRLRCPGLCSKHLLGRTLGPVALVLGALLMVGLPLHYWHARQDLIQEQESRSAALASSIAFGIDGGQHAEWQNVFPANKEALDWRVAPREMQSLRERIGDLAHMGQPTATISTLLLSDKNRDAVLAAPRTPRASALEMMVSNSNAFVWRAPVDYQPMMESAILEGKAASSGLLAGTEGRSVVGWAPIIDGFGAVHAIVQVEVPLEAKLAGMFHSHLNYALGILCLLGGALALGALRLRRSTRALAALGQTARAGIVEDPFLADDVAEEVLALADHLEARRCAEETTRNQLTVQMARAEHMSKRSKQDLGGHERFRHALSAGYPTALRRVASAVGRISPKDLPEEEISTLRDGVLKTCELARVLDQHRELADLRGGRVALKKTALDLRRMIAEAVLASREAAADREVDLRLVVGDGVPNEVQGDEALLRRCLSIFTENAVQSVARVGGGSVSVRVNRLEGTNSTDVRFELCDSSPGLSEAETKLLFDPFPGAQGTHRRREYALDASLCIASELVKLHGAELSLESVPGSGTRIAFTIPFALEADQQRPVAVYEAPSFALAEGTVELELGRK